MQTIGFQKRTFGTLLARAVTAEIAANAAPRCSECHKTLKQEPLEVLADLGEWHLGWRKSTCTACARSQSKIEITRGEDDLEYQTHPIV